jgi:histidinol-phosphatase
MPDDASPSTTAILDFALAMAREADALSMSYYRGELGTEAKQDGTLVTLADHAVEELLRTRIGERFPEHSILGEEQGYSPGAAGAARWILDPIDGTHGFARGLPIWATLIALERDGEIEVGVVSAPALGMRWWAGRGLGAWRASALGDSSPERIHVSSIDRIEDMQLLYGAHWRTENRWPHGLRVLLERTWRTRGIGDFWQHCLVAEGAAEAALEGDISPWDIAPLQVIIEEAGGRLTGGEGERSIDVPCCVTSNGVLHDELLRVLRSGEAPAG